MKYANFRHEIKQKSMLLVKIGHYKRNYAHIYAREEKKEE